MHTHAFIMALWTIWEVFFCGCAVLFFSNAKCKNMYKIKSFPDCPHKLQNVGILFSLTRIRPQHHPSETEHKRSIFNAVSTTCWSALSSKAYCFARFKFKLGGESDCFFFFLVFHKVVSFFIVHPGMIPKIAWFDSRLQMKHITFYTLALLDIWLFSSEHKLHQASLGGECGILLEKHLGKTLKATNHQIKLQQTCS